MKRAALVALLLALASAAAAQLPSEEEMKKSCAAVANWKPTPDAIATDADRKEFAGEPDCTDWIYRIVGDEFDPVKARRCCLVKGNCNRELGVVFANGWGVKRDYDAATYFLCRAESEIYAPFEWWGMIAHVEKMRAGATTDDLTYCNHVTSGRGQLFCEQIALSRHNEEAEKRIDAVKNTLPAPAQAKLDALLTAAQKYADEEGGHQAEDSRGGTGYPAFVLEAEIATHEGFVKLLEEYSKARAPKATAGDFEDGDRLLNRLYQRVLKGIESCPTCSEDRGKAGREALRDAQRAWITYRDAWAAYYAARWSGAAPVATLEREVRTALTKARIAQFRKELDDR